jgi:ATP-binding cassette subfamily B protein
LFLVTTTFVGQIDMISRHLPDLQEGLGALLRLRTMMQAEREPLGGRSVPDGPLDLCVRGLSFAYPTGAFALSDIDIDLAAGHSLALVGRTGSGKSTLCLGRLIPHGARCSSVGWMCSTWTCSSFARPSES